MATVRRTFMAGTPFLPGGGGTPVPPWWVRCCRRTLGLGGIVHAAASLATSSAGPSPGLAPGAGRTCFVVAKGRLHSPRAVAVRNRDAGPLPLLMPHTTHRIAGA